jgi:hypothetical protein
VAQVVRREHRHAGRDAVEVAGHLGLTIRQVKKARDVLRSALERSRLPH